MGPQGISDRPGKRHVPDAVEEGAETIVRIAQLGPDGPTGGYFGAAGPLPQ
ncbi:hypothetical protein [Streptomyces sp. NPDC012616]|uniref:hypothetical protein n=1 Tax=Streptomyces sp. NPDC012616 TaxID=3364840 RepID=UPI0036E67C35